MTPSPKKKELILTLLFSMLHAAVILFPSVFVLYPPIVLTLTQEEEGNLPVIDIPLLRERYSPQGENLGRVAIKFNFAYW